jgi:hypothetical protein
MIERDVYGVAVTDGVIDAMATRALRDRFEQRRPRSDAFDFGPAREKWEHIHSQAAERIAEWHPTLPPSVRRYAQTEFYRRLHMTGAGPYGAGQITVALSAVGDALGQPVESLAQAAE